MEASILKDYIGFIGVTIAIIGFISKKINGLDTKLTAKIDDVDTKLTAMIERLDTKLTTKIDDGDTKLTAMIERLDTKLTAKIEENSKSIVQLDKKLNRIEDRIEFSNKVVYIKPSTDEHQEN